MDVPISVIEKTFMLFYPTFCEFASIALKKI